MSGESINEPVKDGGQTLRVLLRGVFEITKTRLGAYALLNASFGAKGLNGRLLATIFSQVPALHTQLAATNSLARHRFEDVPVADLTAHQFRELLAHYYGHTIRTLESETATEESTMGADSAFIEQCLEIRERELVEMAATMVELETNNPAARKVTVSRAQWEQISVEMSRALDGSGIEFPGFGPGGNPLDVISRVRLAFILILLGEEAQSTRMSTLRAYLRQIQDLGDCGIESNLIVRMWFLPSETSHNNLERREEDSLLGFDFTNLQAVVGRWRDLLRAAYPQEVTDQLHAGNWSSALRLLKGNPRLFESLKFRIMEIIQLQSPFMEILEEVPGQKRFRLPFGMDAVFRDGPVSQQMSVASEILARLGSKARYPVLFIWQENGHGKGCLEILDARPDKAPTEEAQPETAEQRLLLRVFRQAWGIAGQPNAADFANPTRLMESAPCGIEVDAGIVTEIQEACDLHTMSAALTRVENALVELAPQLPEPSGENVIKNVGGLRRLMRKAGVRKRNGCLASVSAKEPL